MRALFARVCGFLEVPLYRIFDVSFCEVLFNCSRGAVTQVTVIEAGQVKFS